LYSVVVGRGETHTCLCHCVVRGEICTRSAAMRLSRSCNIIDSKAATSSTSSAILQGAGRGSRPGAFVDVALL
jgi:hypothetical protein